MLAETTAIAVILTFGTAMFAAGAARRKIRGLEMFLVAGRSVGTIVGAMSVASTWIWAPALFIAAQKAYQQGLAGLMWFTVPNVGSLVLFAFLARRIRKIFPRGYTLPQYIAQRFDAKTHQVYLFSFLSLQVCSLAVQLIAGAALLQAMSGISYRWGVIILVALFTSYSLVDGLRASIRTDFLQMLIIGAGIVVLVPPAVTAGGGFDAIVAGFSGVGGRFTSVFDVHVAYTFGITVTIGLMSGPVGDQQHWQRAFSFKEGTVFRGYLFGALIFALVPLSMSLLGFIAAGNPDNAPAVASNSLSAQQVGPEVIRTLLPEWGLLAFMVMILSGLASTGDSALCAGGSLVAVDIYRKYIDSGASDHQVLSVSRLAILLIAAVAAGITMIPGITILSLFLFYGTLRSSTLMPTIILLFRENIPAWGIFWGVASAIVFGLPVYLAGELSSNVHLKVGANIGIVLISGLLPLFSAWYSDRRSLSTNREGQK